MHISRRKHEAEDVVGVPRELSNGSDRFYWRDRCVSEVLAGGLMATASSGAGVSFRMTTGRMDASRMRSSYGALYF